MTHYNFTAPLVDQFNEIIDKIAFAEVKSWDHKDLFGYAVSQSSANKKSLYDLETLVEDYEGIFSKSIAHEINNPLTTISGQLQLRLSGMDSSHPDYHVYETLEEETQRIAETVRSLVTFAQAREPAKEIVNLNNILTDVIYSFKDTEREREIQVVESLDNDLPMIMADKEQIALVCRNIIDNSRMAINGRGGLKIATKKGMNNSVNIAFYDSGKGIPPDVIERIFDPFFVVNDEERGMGLGLCISRDIIKRHGGSLTVKSQKGKGTIFQLSLPVEAV